MAVAVMVASVCMALPAEARKTDKKSVATEINAGSYNLRFLTKKDSVGGNYWTQRYPHAAELVRFHDFDIFGTQELVASQIDDMQALLPEYRHFGAGREDGKRGGEHSTIFYRPDKYELLESGDFWLSETPDVPSRGWDAMKNRICTWGKFRCKDTGFTFMFFNLHMDHKGVTARSESAKLVRRKLTEIGKGLPGILTGDFNVDQRNPAYVTVLEGGEWLDSYDKAEMRYAPNGTYNGFRTDSWTDRRIDHIFVTPGFRVKKYGVLTDTYRVPAGADAKGKPAYEARNPSDHFPLKVVLEHK